MNLAALALLALCQGAEPGWWEGERLTAEWGGARTFLSEHGVSFDLVYATEVYVNATSAAGTSPTSVLGHLDAALLLETQKLGLWPGGRFYVLLQNNHGLGPNGTVGSSTAISNLEEAPYTQLTEFFFEQGFFDDRLRLRLGRQDANREFGTPRFGGNFINNNFGMVPTAPLPSYPTTELGFALIVQPLRWLTAKALVFDGKQEVGGTNLQTSFRPDSEVTLVAGLAASHRLGEGRAVGITSAAGWNVWGSFPELGEGLAAPRTFGTSSGFFVQHDERVFYSPEDPEDPRSLTVILRFGWAQPDRANTSLYAGGSVAWHGLGARRDDTVGIGFGWFTVNAPEVGGPPNHELFVELFYKWRLSHFLSLQPDLQLYDRPAEGGRGAVVLGARLKLKL
jgi:carbohydrate-selective porin OprB